MDRIDAATKSSEGMSSNEVEWGMVVDDNPPVDDGPPGLPREPRTRRRRQRGSREQRWHQQKGGGPGYVGEDADDEWPLVGSRVEQATALASGWAEMSDGELAIVVERIERGRRVPLFRAVKGRAEEIQLTPPTGVNLSQADKDLEKLHVGSVVRVREKHETKSKGVVTSWVLLEDRTALGYDQPGLPKLLGKIASVEEAPGLTRVTASICFMDKRVRVLVDEVPGGDVPEVKHGAPDRKSVV